MYVELRWLRWGRWHVGRDEGGERTRAIVADAQVQDICAIGGKYTADDERPRPTVAWIIVCVLQEFVRHAGHLDIVRELIDASADEL